MYAKCFKRFFDFLLLDEVYNRNKKILLNTELKAL